MYSILFEPIISFTLLLRKGIMKTLFLILPLAFSTGLSQDQYWYVFLSSGDTLSGMSLESFSRDSLYLRDSTRQRSVYIDSIIEIRHFKGGGYSSGAKAGAGVGAVVGAVLSGWAGAKYSRPGGWPLNDPHVYKPLAAIVLGIGGGLLGGVLGFITGGGIGSATSFDEPFDFSAVNHMGKLNIIYQLFLRQQQIK
jgi:hypothetical protein